MCILADFSLTLEVKTLLPDMITANVKEAVLRFFHCSSAMCQNDAQNDFCAETQ